MPASAPQFYPPVQSPSIPTPDQYGSASTSLRVPRPPLIPSSYVQGTYGPLLLPPGVVPIQSWNPYSVCYKLHVEIEICQKYVPFFFMPLAYFVQAPLSPVLSPGAQPAVGPTPLYGVTPLSSSTPALARPYPSFPSSADPSSSNQNQQSFPERPGEPQCQYYMRTGDCKFGSSCRYHHPRDRVVPSTVLSPSGLPLRPV